MPLVLQLTVSSILSFMSKGMRNLGMRLLQLDRKADKATGVNPKSSLDVSPYETRRPQ